MFSLFKNGWTSYLYCIFHKNMMLMAQAYHQSTFELPVKETSAMRASFAIAWPISAPPQKEVNIAPGKLFFSKTSATSFVTAIVINGVVGAPFLKCVTWKVITLVIYVSEYSRTYCCTQREGADDIGKWTLNKVTTIGMLDILSRIK